MQTNNALSTRNRSARRAACDPITDALSRTTWMRRLSRFYSDLTGEDISAAQATYYLYAQVMVLGMLLPYAMGEGWRVAMLMGLVWSINKSRHS